MTPRHPRPALLALVTALALGAAACDQQQLDDVRQQLEDGAERVQSELEDVTVPEVDVTVPELEVPQVEVPEETPTAEPPTTAEPTTPAPAPSTTAPSPTPAPSPSPLPDGAEEETGVPWWVWALLVLLLALAAWALAAAAGRRRDRGERLGRLRDEALRDVDWLLGAAREQRASADAAARVRDVRVRTDRLGDNLRQLEASAPERGSTAAVDLRLASTRLSDELVAELDGVARGERRDDEHLALQELARDTRQAAERLRDTVRGRTEPT